ncbi:hypothetical protein QZH41_002699 [Actinostola sp. cb2023]|nr:hypothetical protein QZH41_002699 [Actinostola sp. cb2023]
MITSLTSEKHNDRESSEPVTSKSPKKKLGKKSKRRSQSSSDCESPVNKKPKIERETESTSIPNGDVHSRTSTSLHPPWTYEEEEILFEKVGEYLDVKERSGDPKKPFYMKSIEWDKIQPCGEHTPQETQARFLTISHRVRKMKTAREVLEDMKLYHKNARTTSRKKKVVVDPDLPKKPLSSYLQYLQAKRSKFIEKHPGSSNIDITQRLSKRWNKLSDEKKQKYSDSYYRGMEQYQHQMVEYLKKHNPEVTPPLSSFDLWAVEESKTIKNARPDITDRKLKKKLTRRWNNIDSEGHSKWDQTAKKEFLKFKKRVISYQKKAQQLKSSD